MKRILYATIFSLLINITANGSNIPVSVALPSKCDLGATERTILKNKLISMATAQDGIATTEFGAIAMVPSVSPLEIREVNGGMRRIFSIEIEVHVSIVNIITNTIFHSTVISCHGEGYSEADASRNAIRSINESSPEYNKFMAIAKDKILTYYDSNTNTLKTKASTMAKMQNYEEALVLLSTYPEFLPRYEEITSLMEQIFKQYQNYNCSKAIMEAQSAFAIGNYELATFWLSGIETQSSCYSDAKNLQNKIHEELEKEKKEAKEIEKEKREALERTRFALIDAAKSIATSYFNQASEYIFL